MSLSELLEYNPWWNDKKAIHEDPQIKAWEESELKWIPGHMFKSNDYIYSLRGPRQVGKTTLIKLRILQILKRIPQGNVMYYSFELENSPRDIITVINEYFNRPKQTKEKRRFIFLDEVSNIVNWQRAIKKLKDQGKLENCTVVVTGSHSMDVRHATELLPGRRGTTNNEILDKILSPMKFSEYISTVDKQMKREMEQRSLISTIKRSAIIKNLIRGKIDNDLMELSTYQNELNKHFDNYLLTGGIPTVVNEFVKNGFIQNSFYETQLDTITGDLKRANKDISYIAQLIPNIITSIGTEISWNTLKKNSDIGSHHTVEEYVKTLADMFVLSIFYKYNSVSKMPKFDSGKKIYFRDPFFLHGLNGSIHQKESFKQSAKSLDDPKFKSSIVEQIVAEHMTRLAFNITERKIGFNYQYSAFYWKNKNKKEVDFVVRNGDSFIPVEVKYQNQIKKDDLYGIIDFKKIANIKNGIVLTKDQLRGESEAVLIPTSLFLLLV